jgi:hypothetical protein
MMSIRLNWVAVALLMLLGPVLGSGGTRAQEAPWRTIERVLTSPRCLNCHPRGDRPTQGDAMRVHRLNVQRGPEGHGVAAMRCATCHQNRNQDMAGVPGAPHWHLAPASMGWVGLSAGELCRAIKDPTRNGDRSLIALATHMTEDALVRWAWTPGRGRSPPPVARDELAAALEGWIKSGAPCPD